MFLVYSYNVNNISLLKGPDALELKSVQMTIDLLNWDTENTLYFTVTSYKIGKEDVGECEGYR